ncbi:MAG: UBP-type zinc finger domain-containing protein [Gemmatimonadales bacterium]
MGCCESHRAHDTHHWRESGHPIIRSLPLTERSFTWCYVCNSYLS